MKQYLDLLYEIRKDGADRGDRTGTGTRALFGKSMRFDLSKSFPLLTTKKVHVRSIIHELLWFLTGDTNTRYLTSRNVNIWQEWANDDGDLGPVYGQQWRSFGQSGIDQIAKVIDSLRNDPEGRRHIVTAWNPEDLHLAALPPCHVMFQFFVANGKLSCHLYQRSGDMFLGVPFNIASYSLLTHMIAQQCNLEVGEFIHTIGDAHIYKNHFDQVDEQLSRTPTEQPILLLGQRGGIDDYTFEDFSFKDYHPQAGISAPISV